VAGVPRDALETRDTPACARSIALRHRIAPKTPDSGFRVTPSPQRAPGRRIMISCGEASGDLYAGALVRAMRSIDPHVSAFGFGGGQLQAAGAELVGDYRGLSVTGLVEVVRHL